MRKSISFVLAFAVLMSLLCVPVFAAMPAADSYSPKATESKVVKGFYDIGTNAKVTITPMTTPAGVEVEAISIDADDDGVFEELYPDSESLNVVLSGAVAGKNYIVYLCTTSGVPTTNSAIIYVKQEAAPDGTVTFDVYPAEITKSKPLYLSITSDADGFSRIEIPLYYCASSEHWLEPTGGSGATVSGKASSWDDLTNVKYYLYDSSKTDDDIKADIQLATPSNALAYTVSTEAIAENGSRYEQSFSFANVSAGNYKLAVFKPSYLISIGEITVGASDFSAGTITLHMYGDVQENGTINATDITMARAYYKGNTTLSAQQIAQIDMNADAEIKAADITMLRSYYKENIASIPSKY